MHRPTCTTYRIRIFMLFTVCFLHAQTAFSQLKIGGDPKVIQASSILELEATDRGLLFPRMTEAERDSITLRPGFNKGVSHGLMVYNTDDRCVNFYDSALGGNWINMCRVHIPFSDTVSANMTSPKIGDVITDSDCDCIMTFDSSHTWRPAIKPRGGFDLLVLNGDTLYTLAEAARFYDTLVFTSNERLGIGVSNPGYGIDLASADGYLLRLAQGSDIFTVTAQQIDSVNSTVLGSAQRPVVFYSGPMDSANYLRLDTNGSIDITRYGRGDFGTKSPSYLLGIDSAGNLVEFTGFTAVSSSDVRLKKDINSLRNAASRLYDINGVSYHWQTDVHPVKRFDSTELSFGVLAQEVEKIYPNLVTVDDQGYRMVNYIGFVPLLIENQKALQQEVDDLKATNRELMTRLEILERKWAISEK